MKHLKKFNNDFKNADLSKDMKKQNQKGKVTPKPVKKKKLSSDEFLSKLPKKGNYSKPSSKKLSSEEFLSEEVRMQVGEPIQPLSIGNMDPQSMRDKINELVEQVNFLYTQCCDECPPPDYRDDEDIDY